MIDRTDTLAAAQPTLRLPSRTLALALAATLAGLSGCGGGGDSGATQAEPTQPSVSPTRTVSEHAALRSNRSPMPAPTAAQRSAVLAATQGMALDQLRGEMPINAASVIAVPALVFGHVGLMRQGAAGTTLAELEQRFPSLGDAVSDSLLTESLSRQVYGAVGHRFLTSFLDTTDGNGQPALLATWSGRDADFSAGATPPVLPTGAPDLPADRGNLRLAVLDQLDSQLTWPAAAVEEGVFRSEADGRSRFSFVRLRDGVRSSSGAGYRSDFLRQATRTLVLIRPDASAGPIGAWVRDSANGLERALREIALAITATPASQPAGELLLPLGLASLRAPVTPVMWRRGVTLAYSDVQANFSNLDGSGGTYAISSSWRVSGAGSNLVPATRLEFRANGADVLAQHLTSFEFSPSNTNAPIGGGVGNVNPGFTTCPRGGVDLGPYLLAQLDDYSGWVWIASFTDPPGGITCIGGISGD